MIESLREACNTASRRLLHAIGVGVAVALLAPSCGGDAPRGPALQVTGESTKLRAGDPLPAASPFFDGERVRLRGARGEVLGLIVWRAEAGEVPVALAIDGAAVAGHVVAHHTVRRPSTRMYGPSRGAGAWPDRLAASAMPVPTTRAAYFTVTVPRDAAPGPRAGTLTVGEHAFPVELQIDAVELPPLGAAPRVWAYYDPREIARASGLDGAAAFAAELRWSEMFRAHGVAASPDMGLDDWPRRRPQVEGLGYVPVVLPDDPVAEAAAIRGWVDALAWTGFTPFSIPVDEPRRLWQKLVVRERAGRVRAAGGGSFLYAVTDRPHFVYGGLVDIFISPFAVTRDEAHWTYNGTPPFAGAMVLDTDGAALRTWGWIAFRWHVPLWYVWDAAYWSDRHNARRRGGPRFPPASDLDADAVSFDDGEDRGNLDGVLGFWGPTGPEPSLRLAALRRGLQDRVLLELLARCRDRHAADAIAARLVPTALGDAGKPGDSRPGAWPTDEAAWEAARVEILDALTGC